MTPALKVLSSLATREAYLELAPAFERARGVKIDTTWAGTNDIMKRMAAGEVFDVVVSSSKSLGELVKQGHIMAASPTALARCGIGVAVRAGSARPDIGTSAAFRQTLLNARSIGYSTGPSGVYLAQLFERLEIAGAVKTKTQQVPSGMTVGPIIASGEAEIGFQQVSELIHAEGVDYIGPLPAELQNVTEFSAGVHAKAGDPRGGRDLIGFLTSAEAAAVMRRHGLEAG